MAISRLKPPADPETDNGITGEAETQPLRVPKITRGAQVATTIKYTADIETDETENENRANQINDQNQNGFGSHRLNGFEREIETQSESIPTNRLANLFDELRSIQNNIGETFYAFVTRKADLMNDSFRHPCRNNESFAPMQITAQSLLEFIPTIQRYNNNSGGRFDIRVADENGQDLEIGLAALVIADPIQTATAEKEKADNGLSDVLQLMMQAQQKSDERFAALLLEMNKPKDDEFLNLVKEKMRNDFLNPPERKGSSSEEMIAGIFQSQLMIQTISEKFADQLGSNKDGEKKSTLEMLLSNEVVMEKAGNILEDIVEATQTVLSAKMQANGQQTPTPPQYAQQKDGYPPLPPQPEQPIQDTTEIDMNKEIIKRVIDELESDNPITYDNAVIKEFQIVNPDLFTMLKGACMMMPFNMLLTELEKLVPETFEPFYTGEELNERGEKAEARLLEFYNLMKTDIPVPAAETPPAPKRKAKTE